LSDRCANVAANSDVLCHTVRLWQVRWRAASPSSLNYHDGVSSSQFAHGTMMGPFGGGPVPSCAGPSAGPLASSFVGCQAAFPIQSQQLHHRIQSTQRAMHYGKSASSPPNHPQAQFHTTPVAQLVFTSGPLRAIGCDVSAQVNGMLVCVAEATSVHNPIPLNDSASGMVAEEASGTGRACCSGVSGGQCLASSASLEQYAVALNAQEAHKRACGVDFSQMPAEDCSASGINAAIHNQQSICSTSSASTTDCSSTRSVVSARTWCDTFLLPSAIPGHGVASPQPSPQGSNTMYSHQWPACKRLDPTMATISASVSGPVAKSPVSASVDHNHSSQALIGASDPAAALCRGICTCDVSTTGSASDRNMATLAASAHMAVGADAGGLWGGVLANAYTPPPQSALLGLVTAQPDAARCASVDKIAGPDSRGTSSSRVSVSNVGACGSISDTLMAGLELGTKPNSMPNMEVSDIGRLALPPPLALDSLSGLLTPAPLPLPFPSTALHKSMPGDTSTPISQAGHGTLSPLLYTLPTHPVMPSQDLTMHNTSAHSGVKYGGGRSSGKCARGCRSQSCSRSSSSFAPPRPGGRVGHAP